MPVSLRTNWSRQRFCTGKVRGMRTWRSCAQHRTIQIPCHGLVSSNVSFYFSESQYSVLLHYCYSYVLMRISMSMYVHVLSIFLSSVLNHHRKGREKFWQKQCLETVCIDSLLEKAGAKYGKMLRDETSRRYLRKRKQEDTKVLNHGCQLQSSSEKSIKQFCGDPAAAASSFSRMLPECQCVFGCDHGKSLDWISQHCRHTTIILVCKPANPGVLVWGWPKRPAAPSQCHFQLFGWDHDLSRGTHDSEGCMKFIF